MGPGEWLLVGLAVVVTAFVILRPDLWNKRGRRHGSDGGGTAVGVDGTGRRHDGDNDGGSDGDGGGGGD